MVTLAPPSSNAKCYPSILRTGKATVSILKNKTRPNQNPFCSCYLCSCSEDLSWSVMIV